MQPPSRTHLALQRVALFAILALATFLRFWKLGTSPFGFDAAALGNLAARFVETGSWPTQGMVSSVGINNPPLAVYLFSLPVLLTRDPVLLIGLVALVNVVGVWGCYWLVSRHWGAGPGLLAALLLASSPWAVYYSRGVWAQDLLMPGIILFVALLLHWATEGRSWALAAAVVAAALLAQIHFAALALFPVLIAVIIAGRLMPGSPVARSQPWRPLVVGAVIGLALYAPYLASLAARGPDVQASLAGRAGSGGGINWQAFDFALMNIGGRNIHALAGSEQYRAFLATVPPLKYAPDRAQEVLVVLSALYLLNRMRVARSDPRARLRDLTLLLWLILPVLLFAVLPTPAYPHYLLVISPAPYIVPALAVCDLAAWIARRSARPVPVDVSGAPGVRVAVADRPAYPRALAVLGVATLALLVAWQVALNVRIYAFAEGTHTPGGLGTPAGVYKNVAQQIEAFLAENPAAEVMALCPGLDPRWSDPRWDECPAVLEFVAGKGRAIAYRNFVNPLPAPPEADVDRLVVVAPGGDAAISALEEHSLPLPEATVRGRAGEGDYLFFVVRNSLRNVALEVGALAQGDDAVLVLAPVTRDAFSRFYRGPAQIVELPPDAGAAQKTLDRLGRERDRLFVVDGGGTSPELAGTVDEWLNENAFKAFDSWIGDARLAIAGASSDAPRWRSADLGAGFEGQLRLNAASIAPANLSSAPGDLLRVELEWQVAQPAQAGYTLFLQLIGPDDRVAAQSDALLSDRGEPALSWPAGAERTTRHGLLIPYEITPGRYSLIAGLYRADQPGFPRLPVSGAGVDHVVLTEIEVR